MSVFAAVWWIAGVHLSGSGSPAFYGVAFVVTAAMIVLAWRSPKTVVSEAEDARQGRLVGIASGVEGLAILVAVNVCINLKRPDLIAPAVAVIVGLHFIPLALWLPAPLYWVTSVALVAVGACSVAIADPLRRVFVVSIGAASLLWLTSIFVLVRSARSTSRGRERGSR